MTHGNNQGRLGMRCKAIRSTGGNRHRCCREANGDDELCGLHRRIYAEREAAKQEAAA